MQESVNTLQIGGMVKLAKKNYHRHSCFLREQALLYWPAGLFRSTVWSTVPGMEYFILFLPFVMPALT